MSMQTELPPPLPLEPMADQKAEERNDALKSNRLCTIPGCGKRVRSKGLCKAHGGGRRCMVEGCERSSQGQGLCIRHGGGKRCTRGGCTKASQSNGLCKAHGGGLRCQAPNCSKSSQGGGYCRAHGGGQRCEKEGCTKGAQRGGRCAGHGGSRFCQHPDCTKNDRGGGFCAEHGGGKRCDSEGCNKPARKRGKCSFHANSTKGKPSKGEMSEMEVPSGPPNDGVPMGQPNHMMDMRPIAAPHFNSMSAMRDQGAALAALDRGSFLPPPQLGASPYQRQEVDAPRFNKGFENVPTTQYLQIHTDQRSYEPIRHQYPMPIERGYREYAKSSPHQWREDRHDMEGYVEDVKEPPHMPSFPYGPQSHLSAADSAAMAPAAYEASGRPPYYQQVPQESNMAYYASYSQPNQMQHMHGMDPSIFS